MNNFATSFLAAALSAVSLFGQSEVLANYDFVQGSLADDANNGNVTASDMTTNRDVMFWTSDNGFYTNICMGDPWQTRGGYLEFSVTPDAGQRLNLSELDINYGGHGAFGDVDRMEIYADESAGPSGNNFQTLIFGSNNLNLDFDINLSSVGFLQGIADTVTFRIEFFGTDGWHGSNHEVDHFRLHGEREEDPQPAGNPCIGEQFFFGSNWSGSYYTVGGAERNWYFPHWSSDFDVACIDNGDHVTNGIPAIWSKNDCSIGCRRLTFTVKGRDHDGDSIGFTLGFCAGDETNPDADYLAVIWNGSDVQQNATLLGCAGAGTRPDGLHLVRVFGVPDPQEFWSQSNLDLPCSDLNSGVEFLQEGNNLGDTGWPVNVDREITVELLPNNLKVFVEGVLEIDRDGDFSNLLDGCFGYYNQSQFADYFQLEVEPLNPVTAETSFYGEGLDGCFGTPEIFFSRPVLGTTSEINIPNPGTDPALCCFFVNTAPADIFVPFIGGSFLVDLNGAAAINAVVPSGGLTLPCIIPDDSCAAGAEVFFQLVCVDACAPNGIAMSRGLRVQLGDL